MKDPDLNLDIQNAEALSRCEALSLILPEDRVVGRNPFLPPLCDEDDGGDDFVRALRWS